METSPENTSETTIAKPLTIGYRKALALKMAKLQLASSLWETRFFKRFYAIPTVLSNTLFVVIWVFICIYLNLELDIFGKSIWAAIAKGALFGAGGLIIASLAKMQSKRAMVRKRLWLWGKDKFDSWDEFAVWVQRTSPEEIEFLAGEPDDAWQPVPDGGSIEVTNWDSET